MDTLSLFMFSIVPGTLALLFSILSWRLKTELMFWLGVAFTAIILLVDALNFDAIIFLFSNQDTIFSGVIIMICLILPICFLIASKLSPDKLNSDSDVTDEYLNNIINSEDEKNDFE